MVQTMEEILSGGITYKYRLLARMQQDCLLYIAGDRREEYLWTQSVTKQIDLMVATWNSIPTDKRPKWLSLEQIKEFEKQMNN